MKFVRKISACPADCIIGSSFRRGNIDWKTGRRGKIYIYCCLGGTLAMAVADDPEVNKFFINPPKGTSR